VGVAVAGEVVVVVVVAAVAPAAGLVVAEVVEWVQAVMVTQVVEVEIGIVAVEVATVGIRVLGGSLQETLVFLGNHLAILMLKEVLQVGDMGLGMDRCPLVTVVVPAMVTCLQ